jgi:hypothetical protein
MATIRILCDTCGKTTEVERTKEIPKNVVLLGCNWCSDCEDKAEDVWDEWWYIKMDAK